MQTEDNNIDFSKLKKYLSDKKEFIDERLDICIKNSNNLKLKESMKYSLMAGGKRLRPILAITTAQIFDCDIEKILPIACAIEMIHTFSLIHDDLPAIDNDDLRRGKKTNHVLYGEAIAIIAGDALLADSFSHIIKNTPSDVSRDDLLRVIEEISLACGSDGMCGGQAIDILSEKQNNIDKETLKYIHTHKTADMIKVSIRSGAIIAKAKDFELEALTDFGNNLGLAFQIVDDILDVIGEEKELGKKVKKDENKITYPKVYGLDASIHIANIYTNKAIEALSIFKDKAEYLRLIAEYNITRKF